MYGLVRSLLFRLEAEKAHGLSMGLLSGLCRLPGAQGMLGAYFRVSDARLRTEAFGLPFPNPVGLGAGFDKNARHLEALSALGFGFVEVGTVTPRPQPGNPRPRLFRLPADRGLINRMGFNNDGMEAVAQRLAAWRRRHEGEPDRILVGGNIGKNKDTPNEEAWRDYEACYRRLHGLVDYFVVNVSSPNTPGLRALQERDALSNILGRLIEVGSTLPSRTPLLLKIAPDLTDEQIDEVAGLALEMGLDGIVANNTSIAREPLSEASRRLAADIGAGGLSGAPIRGRSLNVLRRIVAATQGRLPVIASGGILDPEDAKERVGAGATLVQVWTGFVYGGPGTAAAICRGLLARPG
ncbi:MAG: quinone-dependent dihydroorotate dehydrogenase [Chitinophagia bacterium]|nr:quinone-dependent dihydroorotate dehydrogenase [Chitinophagia bacterium]